MSLSYINSMDDMKKGAYGILEPKTVRKADENNIDVILVPGLAFDRNGGRMGFGKGYYDRLLESSKAVKIGLCYDFQILEKIPTESHDVPMNFVITEKEILEESVRIGKSSVADIAEWRIDWYQDVFQPRKRNALSRKIRENLQGKPLLVTFRSRREGGERDITPTAYQALLDEIWLTLLMWSLAREWHVYRN